MGVNFFPSRWPVMCAVMNGASDLNLAIAVATAGAMPSLQVDRYLPDGTLDLDSVESALQKFSSAVGNCNLVLSLAESDLLDPSTIGLLKKYSVSHVELLGNEIDTSRYWKDPKFLFAYNYLRKRCTIMIRILGEPHNIADTGIGLCIKGKESAGFSGNVSIDTLFQQQKQLTPGQNLIPYGGIGTPKQVRQWIDKGAVGVAVGTLFAASEESCLSRQVKLQMVSATSNNITQLVNTEQNALILGTLESSAQDWNHEHDLKNGIKGHGGLIYAGSAIDHVTEIKTVKQVVDYLTQDLI